MYPPQYYRQIRHQSNRIQGEIIVEGYYALRRVPDSFIITTRVTTYDNTAIEAETSNKALLNMIEKELKDTGIKDEDFFLIGNTIRPVEDVDHPSFIAETEFNIRLYDFQRVVEYVYNAYSKGLNIEEINVNLMNPEIHYYEALRRAVEDGLTKAKEIADIIGAKIDPIPLYVEEKSHIRDLFEGVTIISTKNTNILKHGHILVEALVKETFLMKDQMNQS